MSVTIGGVSCEEIVDGYEEGIHEQGPVSVKKYLCAWASRYTVANAFLGLSSYTGSGIVNLTRPRQHPESPNMWAREIAIEGRGKPTQGTSQLQFVQAVITVNFGVPQFSFTANPSQSISPSQPFVYARQNIHFGSEMVTVEKSAVTLANGHKLKNTPYAFPLPNAIMTIQLFQFPYMPSLEILAALAAPLNNATFLVVTAGYLMFRGGDTNEEASSDGTLTRDVTYTFAYRPLLRWDEVFDPDGTSGPQQVRYNGAAILLRSDLSNLIPDAYNG